MAKLRRKSKVKSRLVRDRRGRPSVGAALASQGAQGPGRELGLRARSSVADPTAGASDAAYKVYRKYDAVPDDGHEQYTEF